MGFILSFTDKFVAALSLWPFASFMLTLPILAYLYHRDGRLKVWSAASAYLVVLYFLGLGCFTLYPLPSGTEGLGITYGIAPQLNPIAFVGDIYRDGITAVLQIIMNVVFFVPLGFIASRAFRMRFQTTLLLGFATSLLIETAQLTGFFWLYPYAYRTFDVCDLMWNTGGAVAGWWAARLLARVLPQAQRDEDSITTSPGFVRRSVAFMLDGGHSACGHAVRVVAHHLDNPQRAGRSLCGRLRHGLDHARHIRHRPVLHSSGQPGKDARWLLCAHDLRNQRARTRHARGLSCGSSGRYRRRVHVRTVGDAAPGPVFHHRAPHAVRLSVDLCGSVFARSHQATSASPYGLILWRFQSPSTKDLAGAMITKKLPRLTLRRGRPHRLRPVLFACCIRWGSGRVE